MRKQPELAAALSYASSVVCPRCGGTLVNVKLQVPDKNPGRPAGGRDFSRRGERQGTPLLRGRGVSCGLPQRQARKRQSEGEETTMWTVMVPYVHQVLNLGGLVIQPEEWWQWWCCLWAFR